MNKTEILNEINTKLNHIHNLTSDEVIDDMDGYFTANAIEETLDEIKDLLQEYDNAPDIQGSLTESNIA